MTDMEGYTGAENDSSAFVASVIRRAGIDIEHVSQLDLMSNSGLYDSVDPREAKVGDIFILGQGDTVHIGLLAEIAEGGLPWDNVKVFRRITDSEA